MGNSFMTEDESERRRTLLRLAGKGDARAQQELEEEYHVRVYSPAQRASYKPKQEPRLFGALQRKIDILLN